MNEQTITTLPVEQLAAKIKETVDSGETFHLAVTGISMTPTMKPGRDIAELAGFAPGSLKRGDIVFAKRRIYGYMLHRITGFTKNGDPILNGDRQTWSEDVAIADVIAIVTGFERAGKHVDCKAFSYRLYSFFWMLTRPFRNILIKTDRLVNKKDFI